MSRLRALLNSFVVDDFGQDLVEYSLLMVFLALAAIGILPSLGTMVNAVFSRSNSSLAGGLGTGS